MPNFSMTKEQLAKFESRFGKLERDWRGNLPSEQELQLQGWLAAIELLVAPMEVSSGISAPEPRGGFDRRKHLSRYSPIPERRIADRRLM